MTDQPTLTIDEPVVSGWLRSEFYGDADKGKAYLYAARKQLGALKTRYGVNARVAMGEPGGFYRDSRMLPDGTQIETFTNDGHDTVRITVPTSQSFSASTSVGEGESTSFEGQGESTEFTPEFQSLTEPKQPPEEIPESSPYLWVGARIKLDQAQANARGDANMPLYSLVLMMMEPDGADGSKGGIVMSRVYTNWQGNTTANLSLAEPVLNKSVDKAVADFGVSFDRVPAGVHNLLLTNNAPGQGGAGFNYSKNGLRLYELTNVPTYAEGTANIPAARLDFAPYDPELPADAQHGGRDFNAELYPEFNAVHGFPLVAWDQVYVLDPQEDEQTAPSDPRSNVSLARQVLEKAGMASGQDIVLHGDYILKIGAYADPGMQTTRNFPHVASADYDEFRFYPWAPLQVEIEVRLNKAPATVTYSFEVTVQDYDSDDHTVHPYGALLGGCPINSGDNPHAANWAEDAIVIDVAGGVATQQRLIPPGVFVPSPFNIDSVYRRRYPVDIYMYTGAGVSGTPTSTAAGDAVFALLEDMTDGTYGFKYSIRQRTKAEIASAASVMNGSSYTIFLYDVQNNSVTPLPRLADPSDPPPESGWPPLNPNLLWFYPYRLESRAGCRLPIAINMVGPTYHNGAAGEYGDPDLGFSCCEDVFFGN